MEVLLFVALWWFVGTAASVIYVKETTRRAYKRYPNLTEPPFSVGDLIFSLLLGLGGLITIAVFGCFLIAAGMCNAIEAIDRMDTPLFKNKDD